MTRAELIPIPDTVLFLIAYLAALTLHIIGNRAEFKRCPEKGARYEKLPLGFKLLCWFLVTPLFAGTLIEYALALPALISYVILEAACVRWYRKAGLM